MKNSQVDRILIKGIVCQAHLGVTNQEREIPQKVLVDVALFLDLEAAANMDDLQLTVDYSGVVEKVQATVEKNQFRLLEALVQAVCRTLFEDTKIDSVQVSAHKFPESLAGKISNVMIEMSR